mgnify:CR=1 FL=1
MSLTNSTMLELGTSIPTFELPEVVSGKMIYPEIYAEKKGMLVMFICQHCPYVVHVREELAQLGHDYDLAELEIIAISSNDAKSYPDDAPESLKHMAEQSGFVFSLCYDESQDVAKRFTAACTPDFFLFNHSQTLVYRGQLDDSRPGNGKPVTGKDLRTAIESMLSGQPVNATQLPSAGCNIKWKSGNEPEYA